MLETVADWLSAAATTVVFTGAGISTESGIPDFRSPGGVWAKNQPVYFEEFLASPDARYEYWRQKAIAHQDFSRSQPNAGHRVLASWERLGRVTAVITQNIDGLHQLAGSRNVWELHGTARQITCLDCESCFEAEPLVVRFLADDRVPDCPDCGGRLKHATISFGQPLSARVLDACAELCQQADLFFAIGSSLLVQPAASLPVMAQRCGARLVILNRDSTPLDQLAGAVLNRSIGETLGRIDELLCRRG